MQSAGQAVIGGSATPDSVAAHIRDIMALGYNKDIHEGFEEFIMQNIKLIPAKLIPADKWPRTKAAGGNARTRRVGEILVDWTVLEAAIKLTIMDSDSRLMNGYNSYDDFRQALPFSPPKFDMDASSYTTPAARTLDRFGVYVLADSGDYDDIFNQILRWRTYDKEPFNRHYYNQAKNMSGYRDLKALEKKKDEEDEARRRQKAQESEKKREWAENTARDLHDKGKRAEVAAELESMSLGGRLAAIADSDYMLHYYRPHLCGWGKLFAGNNSVFSLKADSRNRLILKLKNRKPPLGWEEVKRQLSEIE